MQRQRERKKAKLHLDHLFVHLPGLVRRANDKLLHFLELVNAEDAPGVLPVRAGLLAKTGRDSGIHFRQLVGRKPLAHVIRTDWLLGGGDEVETVVACALDLRFQGETQVERRRRRAPRAST